MEFKRSATLASSRSKLAKLSRFAGKRQRFLQTIKLMEHNKDIHGFLVECQDISLMSFQSELVAAVLGPQVPWQSSLQTFKNGLRV